MVCGGKMTSRVIFFICLVAVSALSVESVLGPGVEVSFEEMFYSTRKTINNSKDLENVLGKTCRIMAFQSPIVDLYGVRAYFPNEDLNEVKKCFWVSKKQMAKDRCCLRKKNICSMDMSAP